MSKTCRQSVSCRLGSSARLQSGPLPSDHNGSPGRREAVGAFCGGEQNHCQRCGPQQRGKQRLRLNRQRQEQGGHARQEKRRAMVRFIVVLYFTTSSEFPRGQRLRQKRQPGPAADPEAGRQRQERLRFRAAAEARVQQMPAGSGFLIDTQRSRRQGAAIAGPEADGANGVGLRLQNRRKNARRPMSKAAGVGSDQNAGGRDRRQVIQSSVSPCAS